MKKILTFLLCFFILQFYVKAQIPVFAFGINGITGQQKIFNPATDSLVIGNYYTAPQVDANFLRIIDTINKWKNINYTPSSAEIVTALGYTPLSSYTETDPTVPANVKAITGTNISNWNTAFSWGNHATQGYLTSASINGKLNISDTATMLSPYLRSSVASSTYYLANNPSNYINIAGARSALSQGNGITYNSSTGVITNSAPDQTVILTQGSNISITGSYPTFTIAATGEANTASNVGTGAGLFKQKSGVDLQFKTILGTTNQIVVTSNTNDLTLSLPARTESSPARSLVTSTSSTGFQPSINFDMQVTYSVYAQVVSALAGTNTADVYLEVAATNSSTPGDWVTKSRSGISMAGLVSTTGNTQTVSCFVPKGYYVRIRTSATGANAGSAVFQYQVGQENTY